MRIIQGNELDAVTGGIRMMDDFESFVECVGGVVETVVVIVRAIDTISKAVDAIGNALNSIGNAFSRVFGW